MKKSGLAFWDNDVKLDNVKQFLDEEEFERMKAYKDMATQLINQQSRDLIQPHDKEHLTQFQHDGMEEMLRIFMSFKEKTEQKNVTKTVLNDDFYH